MKVTFAKTIKQVIIAFLLGNCQETSVTSILRMQFLTELSEVTLYFYILNLIFYGIITMNVQKNSEQTQIC